MILDGGGEGCHNRGMGDNSTCSIFITSLLLSLSALAACADENRDNRDLGAVDAVQDTARVDVAPDIAPSTCFDGAAFIECPGKEVPRLFCSKQSCKWSSVGFPVGELQGLVGPGCACSGATCPQQQVIHLFSIYRGLTPWTRGRNLDLKVSIDSSLAVAKHAITCSGCSGACSAGDSPCNTTQLRLHDRSLPGTFWLLVGAMSYMHGWILELEVDLEIAGGPKARVCRLPVTDFITCEPKDRSVCATSGTLTLSGKPDKAKLDVVVAYDVTFSDGVKLTGEVAAK